MIQPVLQLASGLLDSEASLLVPRMVTLRYWRGLRMRASCFLRPSCSHKQRIIAVRHFDVTRVSKGGHCAP